MAQSQTQMARLQQGYERLQSELQSQSSKSEKLHNQEAEQLMMIEKEKEYERLKHVRELANL